MKSAWLAITLSLALTAGPASAWNSTGHEQVADIAWTQLTDATKTKIRDILTAGDSAFRPHGTTEASLRVAFRRSATFPDHIKSHKNTVYEPFILTLNRRFEPNIEANHADTERDRCRTFHYYDTPIRFTGHTPSVRASNARKALALATSQLRSLNASGSDLSMQAFWLHWIDHLVGDLHQPLHCVSSYQFRPNGDAGGNKFPIPGGPHLDNLHSFWDSGIDRAKKRESAESGASGNVEAVSDRWTHDAELIPDALTVQDMTVAHWIRDGATLADGQVYVGIERNAAPGETYTGNQVVTCKKQAVLAGFRLAAILNKILGS